MRFLAVLVAGVAAIASSFADAASSFIPTRPPAVPLAVRSPYLNAWLQGDSGCVLPGEWPRFWEGQILGVQGFISVDGVVYNWIGGAPGPKPVDQISLEYTSTKSIFTFNVDRKVNLTVTFLSPVYPDDLPRQSQQFSYISAKVRSSDGAPHSVQIYMDVSGEWASGDRSKVIKWDSATAGDITYHKFFRDEQAEFRETDQIADWGKWFISTNKGHGTSWQIGQDTAVRGQFVTSRVLANTKDNNFRPVNQNWRVILPVFAFSHDLGNVQNRNVERLFTLGIVQDRVIDFAGISGTLQPVPGFWSSYYNDDISSVVAFFGDYRHAELVSSSLDTQIQADSENAAGQNYATITTLAVRQTFGALQIAGTPSKPYIFLKEISSNGDSQTVDVIFPAWPIFMYLNATLGRYLLDPLFENQESGAYPNAYAEHDLHVFPVAKGYPAGDDEAMPLEECGNMIIMSLSYAQSTGDVGYLSAHYPKLSQWADFLVNYSLIPSHQLSTDDFAGALANQTNLAIKGIIGLKAMSKIARLTGNKDTFGAVADMYLTNWIIYAVNNKADLPHTTLAYGDDNSHGLLYNIYADRLLGLNFIPQSIYDMQSNFYPVVALEYGVPLDTRHTFVKSDWEMFAAAVASTETRDMFISKLAKWIGQTPTNRAMTDLFDGSTGAYPGTTFVARPVMGGTFALLALPDQERLTRRVF
ncbi:hypothetical protein B0H63DRAFT_385879 [Podospora didyma]|uniref:Glutaminase A n=1 Tax=Podospora didyma TaxID=330526 RepID=A0AAE0P7S4_9PEZI|nr:hypothetical protein B0H63DRAFT_385879 [Podospora didyma]